MDHRTSCVTRSQCFECVCMWYACAHYTHLPTRTHHTRTNQRTHKTHMNTHMHEHIHNNTVIVTSSNQLIYESQFFIYLLNVRNCGTTNSSSVVTLRRYCYLFSLTFQSLQSLVYRLEFAPICLKLLLETNIVRSGNRTLCPLGQHSGAPMQLTVNGGQCCDLIVEIRQSGRVGMSHYASHVTRRCTHCP